MSHKRLYALLMIFSIAVSGCSLAPKEEVLPDAPVVPTGVVEGYKKIEVMRGDIIDSVTIDCKYKAFNTEELSFNLSGEQISHVYAEEGDYVQAGEILADLEMNDISLQIDEYTDSIKLLELKLSNEKELEDLAISTQTKLRSMEGYTEQLRTKYDTEISGYENTIEELNNNIKILQKRLNQADNEVKNHQIVAGINGIVSFVAAYNIGDTSNKESNFITIYDPDTMVFITNGENSDLFMPGQEVNILVSGIEYPSVVILPEGLINQEEADRDRGVIYLKADDKDNQLQNNDQGEITFLLNELKDVLYLPSMAVSEQNGKSIVFTEDEGGFKSIKEIETGFVTKNKVEIMSGLNEGDSVIVN